MAAGCLLYPLKAHLRRREDKGPLCADTVAKVENRITLKISQKSIFSRLYLCKAL
jgi:hypothetical protein